MTTAVAHHSSAPAGLSCSQRALFLVATTRARGYRRPMYRHRLYEDHERRMRGFKARNVVNRALSPAHQEHAVKADIEKRLKGARNACEQPKVGDRWHCRLADGTVGTAKVIALTEAKGHRTSIDPRVAPLPPAVPATISVMRSDGERVDMRRPAQWRAWCGQSTNVGGLVCELSEQVKRDLRVNHLSVNDSGPTGTEAKVDAPAPKGKKEKRK